MGTKSEPSGVNPQDANVAAALVAVAALLASGEALSGRAVKAALAHAHRRAALETALTRGVETGRLAAIAGARNARLYQLGTLAPETVSSVPSVPPSVSRVSQTSAPQETDAAASPPNLMTRRELAARMNVVMSAVTKWEQAGLPVAERGRPGKPSLYRLEDVQAWLVAREQGATANGTLNVNQERARRERAQASLAEQTFQMRQRDLLPRHDVERIWAAEVGAVRTRLMAWPTTIADRVLRAATLDGIQGVERELHDAVDNVLRELADPARIVDEARPPDDSADDGQEHVA